MQAPWISDALASALLRDSKEGLARQLMRLLRHWISEGRLQGETLLPASRELARHLKVGRNTVLNAYEQLQAEGYLETRLGAGTYVTKLFQHKANAAVAANLRHQPLGLSQRGSALYQTCALPQGLNGAFAPGVPEIRQFPHHCWQQLLARHQRCATVAQLNYTADGGLLALREVLAEYLQLSRSVRCRPEQILITQGAQQGLELVARLLADAGDIAWVEEPGYAGAHAAFRGAGLTLVAAPVNDAGLSAAAVVDTRRPRLIYTTPSHQYPSGVVMPLAQRLALLQHAQQVQAWVIEDDYDSEFRYNTQPIPALQGLAADDRVIYVGTFSKVMYPGLRIGYVVVPEALIDAFRGANARLYREGHYPVQAALADFIVQGHFARHVRRMRELYRERQQVLRHAMANSAANVLPLSNGEAGMHLVASLPSAASEQQISAAAAEHAIWLRPLARHYLGTPDCYGLVLGYAGVENEAIKQGVAVLARFTAQYGNQ